MSRTGHNAITVLWLVLALLVFTGIALAANETASETDEAVITVTEEIIDPGMPGLDDRITNITLLDRNEESGSTQDELSFEQDSSNTSSSSAEPEQMALQTAINET